MWKRERGCESRAAPFLGAEEATINFTHLPHFLESRRTFLGETAQKAPLNRPFVLKKSIQEIGMVMFVVSDQITDEYLGESI